MCKMNKWQYLPRNLWVLKWKALRARSRSVYTRPNTSDVFGRLRTSSGIFGNDRVVFKNPSTPRIKISRLYLRKSWQVYYKEQCISITCCINSSLKRRIITPWLIKHHPLHSSTLINVLINCYIWKFKTFNFFITFVEEI